MSEHADKIFPRPTAETQAYWQACRDHKLIIQRCAECGHHQFYPRIICSACMHSGIDWIDASGRGQVRSFTIIRRPVSEAYAAEVPYVVALVQLEEGPTMMSNIIDCDAETVVIGMQVEVVFEDWSNEISIPKFKPVA